MTPEDPITTRELIAAVPKAILAVLLVWCLMVATLIVASPASAASPQMTVYRDSSGTGDHWTLTTAKSNLSRYGSGLDYGSCLNGFYATWNDCISSFRVTLSAYRCVVLYADTSYRGATYAVHGPQSNHFYNLRYVFNDRASSIRFGSVIRGACTGPWS